MPVVFIRIDDRLIHGQVVEGWLKNMEVDVVAIVSDEVAKDKMQQVLFAMAVPKTIKVSTLAVHAAADMVLSGACEKERVFMLFSNPQDVLRFLKRGVSVHSVNVGGMHFTEGKRQILKNVSVDKDDVDALHSISELNVELEGRVLPNDERVNVAQYIILESKGIK